MPSYQMASNTTNVVVGKDGAYEETNDYEVIILSEAGKQDFALHRLYYKPSRETLEVLSVELNISGKVSKVPKNQIRDTSIAGAGEGLSDYREIIIPFEGIVVGSRLSVKLKRTVRTAALPGAYHSDHIYGFGMMEAKSNLRITSSIPIYYQANNPRNVLQIKESKDKNKWVLEATLANPVHAISGGKVATGEFTEKDLEKVPSLSVSSISTWKAFEKAIGRHYGDRMKEKLPTGIQKYISSFPSGLTDVEKSSRLRQWLRSFFTYSGRWDGPTSDFIPRSIKEIAKSKVADCKDFALLYARLLKELGIRTELVFVYMEGSNPLRDYQNKTILSGKKLVNPGLFNHVITRVYIDQKIIYLDPTSSFIQADRSDLHLHNRKAWVLEPNAREPLTIEIESDLSKIQNSITKQIPGYRVQSNIELRGSIAGYLGLLKSSGKSGMDMGLFGAALAGFPKVSNLKIKKFEVNNKSTDSASIDISFDIKRESASTEGSSLFESVVNVPRMYWSQVDSKVPPLSLDFPMEFKTDTHLVDFYIKSEQSKDCFTLGPYASYERIVKNSDTGVKVEERSKTTLKFIETEDMKRVRNQNGDELWKCQKNSNLEIVKKDPTSKDQTYFDLPKVTAQEWTNLIGSAAYEKDNLMAWRRLKGWLIESPQNADYYFYLGRTYTRMGMVTSDTYSPDYLEEAKKVIRAGLELNKDSSIGWAFLGRAEFFRGNTAEAVSAYVKANKLDSKNGIAYELAALIANRNKKIDHALAYYKLAEKFAPDSYWSVRAINGQIEILAKDVEKKEEARSLLTRLVALKKDDPWNLYNASIYYAEIKDYDKALELNIKALSLKDFGAAKHNMAWILGQKAEAIILASEAPAALSEAEKLIEKAGKFSSAPSNLAKAMFALNIAQGKLNKDENQLAAAKKNLNQFGLTAKEIRPYRNKYTAAVDYVQEQTGKRDVSKLNKDYAKIRPEMESDLKTEEGIEYDLKVSADIYAHILMSFNSCKIDFSRSFRSISVIQADGTISDWIPEMPDEFSECIRKYVVGKKLPKPPKTVFRAKFEKV